MKIEEKKRKGKSILELLLDVGVVFSCLFSSIYFASSSASTIASVSQSISNISKSNLGSKLYSIVLSYDNNSNSSITSIFNSEYYLNFDSFFTEAMTYCNQETNDFLSFDVSCNNQTLSDIKCCDLNTYSNQTKLKRFEKININLYKSREKSEEINPYNTDGFIYIPDYYADNIINNSSGKLSSYDDLLPNLSDLPIEKRNAFLNSYSVTFNNGNNNIESKKFKIANIFHVDGFKTEHCNGEYSYNDDGSGLLLKNFFNNYCFIHPTEDMLGQNKKVLVNVSDSKRFIVSERIEGIEKYNKRTNNITLGLKYFKIKDGTKTSLQSQNEVIYSVLNEPRKEGSTLFLLLYLFFIILLFVVLLLMAKNSYKISNIHFVALIVSLVSSLVIFHILSLTVFCSSLLYLSYYNTLFCSTLSFLILLIIFFQTFLKVKEHGIFNW